MHVLFVEPSFPNNQVQFARALSEAGAQVTGIGEVPHGMLPGEVKKWLDHYEEVPSVCDEGSMYETVRRVQSMTWVDRLEATIEAHMVPVAKVRETCGIPGTSVRTAFLCRDKPAMKEVLRDAGIPTAASAGVSSPEEAREFAARIGFPIIFKPRAGAGAADTEKIVNEQHLVQAIVTHGLDQGASVAAEEFVEGHEGFYDTLSIDGEPVHEFISHYYPGVLPAMRDRSESPYVIVTNRVSEPGYEEVKEMGARVIKTLGIGTSATHMEWFFGPKGLRFSEIGCRPPGVGVWDLYSAANEFDLYREWANAIVHGRPMQKLSRQYSAGMIALRPDRDGRIAGYQGMERLGQTYGEWILDSHFPAPGTPTQPIEAGYMANAWVRMRHPDYDELRRMLSEVGEMVQVHAS